MGLYETIIKDRTGATVANLTGATDRWWKRELNRPGAAGFRVSAFDSRISADVLRTGQKELYLLRNGVVVWGGTILTRRTDAGAEEAGAITVTAAGFLERMSKKVIGTIASPRVFNDEDLSDIADDIRSETQTGTNADLGIDAGSLAASRDADRTYKFENALDAIEGVSNLRVQDGIDLNVDANKQLSTFYPTRGLELNDVAFEWGVNITSFFYIDDATEMANQIIVVGKDDGVSTPTVTRDGLSHLQDEGNYGILQDVITRYNVTDTATLAEWGDREVAKRQTGTQTLGLRTKGNLEPFLGSYDVGDWVRVKIDYGIDHIDALYRITSISVQVTDTDEEDIDIQFGEYADVGSTIDELEERVENLETAG